MCIYYEKIYFYVIGICGGLFIMLSAEVSAHGGEPEHGGDLPVVMGFNPKQYEGHYELTYIKIDKSAFHPDELAVDAGTRVVFENQDDVDHRIVFSRGGETHDHPDITHDHPDIMDEQLEDHPEGEGHELSRLIKPGRFWVLHFIVPGEYPYTCPQHGISGKVNVRY